MSLVGYFSGDSIMLSASGARKVTPSVHPRLFNVVEEMKIAAGLTVMPKVYIIPEKAPNAFATGKKPEKASIAVTAGLLSQLNRDELQGVVAHEMAHIINRDTLYMTFSGVLLGSIIFLSRGFLRGIFFSGGSRNRSRSNSQGGGQLQLILMVASIVFAILAPLFAQLLYFAISRKREYLADATAVRLTRYPEGLASALEKISQNTFPIQSANKATAGLYIVNPLIKKNSLSNLSSTHPPIDDRVRILRKISGGANYKDYQNAFTSYHQQSLDQNIIPLSGISDNKIIPIRQAVQEKVKSEPVERVDDLIRAIDDYFFITCSCGLKIKVPPGYDQPTLNCPRCNKLWSIPPVIASLKSLKKSKSKPDMTKKTKAEEPLIHYRKSEGWDSFSCSCGDMKQLSPSFKKDKFICSNCGRTIIVKKQETS